MYYDSETLTGKYSGYPVLWVKTVYSKDEYHEGKKIDYRLDKIQIFCTDRTLNFLGSYYYFVYETTPDNAPSPGRMESVIPGTIGEALYDKICSK
nr:hypothetical protein [Flavobacterium filum]